MQAISLFGENESTGPQRVSRFPNPRQPFFSINAVTHNWSGSIVIRASIALEPGQNDWFEIVRETIPLPVGLDVQSRNFMWTAVGCFNWIEAVTVDDVGIGRIDRILVR